MPSNREKIRRLMIAVEQLDQAYYKVLRTLGIKENAFVLFYAIADGKPYSQKRLCDEWAVPRTTLNTIVQEYVEKGYIRLASTGHKEKEIVLTDAGKAFADEILTPIFAAEERAIAPFLNTMFVEQTEELANRIQSEFHQIKKQN
ncbi:MAG: MarR family transcriptional regulator [Subdoligranulum variabile]|nr:MAG: MarR family transcriptional regulator [Subdoligranulum variabile]